MKILPKDHESAAKNKINSVPKMSKAVLIEIGQSSRTRKSTKKGSILRTLWYAMALVLITLIAITMLNIIYAKYLGNSMIPSSTLDKISSTDSGFGNYYLIKTDEFWADNGEIIVNRKVYMTEEEYLREELGH